MALTQISTDGIKNGTITGSDLATNVDLVDDQKLRLGNSQNLQIYHEADGSSYITNSTSGHLIIKTINGGSDINLECNDDFFVRTAGGTQNSIIARDYGQVELYYSGNKKFETTSTGANVTGALSTTSLSATGGITGTGGNFILGDNDKIKLGASQDLEIYHDGSSSYVDHVGIGNLFIRGNDTNAISLKAVQSKNSLICHANAQVQLYHNNSLKFETESFGATLTGNLDVNSGSIKILTDSQKLELGASGDLQIFHNGSNSFITNSTGNLILEPVTSEFGVVIRANDAVELYYDNSKKFETASHGATLTGNLRLPDNTSGNASIQLGDSQDFFMNHNGTDSFIINNTGDLYIRDLNGDVHIQGKDNEEGIIVKADASVELYFNNVAKFQTTSSGVSVTGQLDHYAGSYINASGGYVKIQHDSGRLTLGAGEDLQIYHDGTNSVINNTTNDLRIESDRIELNNQASNEFYLTCTANGAVELYHDNSKKVETTSSGVAITGEAALTGGALKLDSHPLVSIASFTDISGGSYAARLGSTGSSTIRSTQIYGGGGHIATFDGVNIRLGINETAPDYMLHLTGTIPAICLEDTTGTHGQSIIEQNDDNLKIRCDAGNASSGTGSNINFQVDGSERMRILPDGKIGFNTTSTTGLGSQTGNAFVCTFNLSGITLTQYSVTAGFYYDRLNFTNSQYFIVNSSGTGVYLGNGSTSFTAHSDERLKTNITELDGAKAYNHVKTARAASFKWNATGYPTDTKIGFIAQDWETDYPEVTNTTTETIDSVENPKGIQYTETIPVLMAALKQAISKIETLETEVAALKAA